jgi:pyruvate dehydrogenase E2 component (dihydrolipoamide acetyltransferase)
MSDLISVNIPDIGDAEDVDVIEILVAEGDTIKVDEPLLSLETDKATMEIPSSHAGVIKKLHLSVGDKVSKGDLILELEAESSQEAESETKSDSSSDQESNSGSAKDAEAIEDSEPSTGSDQDDEKTESQSEGLTETKDLCVPDIGDSADVDVIEVLINQGDTLEKEQAMIVLETDKATMEIPSSDAGEVVEVLVKVGDKVSQGDKIGVIKTSSASGQSTKKDAQAKPSSSQPSNQSSVAKRSESVASTPMQASDKSKNAPVPEHPQMKKKSNSEIIHASPAVRRFARELGADLSKIKGTGQKSRIQKEDVQNFIKFELSRPKATPGSGAFATPQMPKVDHAKWGEVEEQSLTRIQKISSVNLHRNWITIPHVTQHEDADITELDEFRKSMKEEAAKDGVRLTPLAFIMKALVHTLKAFPKFNASLGNDGENLVVKHYYHIGVAVETPDGLTVPVIRDVDKKGIYQLATELGEISAKARDKKLSADDMQGSSFTISSLGGIGGTAFTPIVKWPDVAILGLSRNKMQPVWNGTEFVPRLMLPMSLSYDHRVIDGADAARFVVHLSNTLNDIRRVLLK